MSDKPFKNIDEQISILTKRNLRFINEKEARKNLKAYGYYEIINGYKEPYLLNPSSDNDVFKDGTTFEQVFSLFRFDNTLKSSLMSLLEEFEQKFRQVLAYTIAEEISDKQVNYLAKSHYNTGKTKKLKKGKDGKITKYSDRDVTLGVLNNITKSEKQPFKHYRENHNNIPPWILVKGLTFGNLIYWFKLSKPNIKNKVISELLNIDENLVQNNDMKVKQFFGDVLGLYLDYRNLAAHNGRIYNHRSRLHALEYSPFLYNEDKIDISKKSFNLGNMRSSIGTVIYTLSLLNRNESYRTTSINLQTHLLSLLLNLEEEDKEFFVRTMEVDFLLKPTVHKAILIN